MTGCNGCIYARSRGSCVMCAHPLTREWRALLTPWEGGESAAMLLGLDTDDSVPPEHWPWGFDPASVRGCAGRKTDALLPI